MISPALEGCSQASFFLLHGTGCRPVTCDEKKSAPSCTIIRAKAKFSTKVKKNGVKWSKVGNLFLL
jgi:hypothetical protein